jgi:oligopeptide/dipeptide ABC transporter ATP-binding protein
VTEHQSVVLAVDDVTVTYRSPGRPPVVAVSHVSLTLESGRTTALIGESGSGKSTLGKAIARLQPIDGGTIELDGSPFGTLTGRTLRSRRPRVQMIFQDPHSALNPRRTILKSVSEPLRVRGEGKARARELALEALDRVGITPRLAHRYPHQLSGGQKQRVNIARALLTHPRVVVCDEPVSALDVSLQAEIINLLIELRDEEQLTLLFITHDISLLPHVADDVAVMYLSEIVEVGTARAVVTDPAHPYTMGLLAAAPQLGPATGYERVQIRGDVPDPATPPSGCRFHPRCPFAVERCAREHPELRPFGAERQVACHLAEELADAAHRVAVVQEAPA